uniref:Putative secreted protein n=1 Tax=Anopheles marajoara TaxID=58244 RepID=A0A2M4CCY7_9DIPT
MFVLLYCLFASFCPETHPGGPVLAGILQSRHARCDTAVPLVVDDRSLRWLIASVFWCYAERYSIRSSAYQQKKGGRPDR